MNPSELKLLKKIAGSHIVTKEELRKFLHENGHNVSVSGAVKNLLAKQYINEIRPVGSTCFVITQKGAKALKEME